MFPLLLQTVLSFSLLCVNTHGVVSPVYPNHFQVISEELGFLPIQHYGVLLHVGIIERASGCLIARTYDHPSGEEAVSVLPDSRSGVTA